MPSLFCERPTLSRSSLSLLLIISIPFTSELYLILLYHIVAYKSTTFVHKIVKRFRQNFCPKQKPWKYGKLKSLPHYHSSATIKNRLLRCWLVGFHKLASSANVCTFAQNLHCLLLRFVSVHNLASRANLYKLCKNGDFAFTKPPLFVGEFFPKPLFKNRRENLKIFSPSYAQWA